MLMLRLGQTVLDHKVTTAQPSQRGTNARPRDDRQLSPRRIRGSNSQAPSLHSRSHLSLCARKVSKRCATLPNNPMPLFHQESFDCGPTAAPWPYLQAKRQPCLGVTQATLRARHSASRLRGKRTAPGDTQTALTLGPTRLVPATLLPDSFSVMSQMRNLELQDGQKVSPIC